MKSDTKWTALGSDNRAGTVCLCLCASGNRFTTMGSGIPGPQAGVGSSFIIVSNPEAQAVAVADPKNAVVQNDLGWLICNEAQSSSTTTGPQPLTEAEMISRILAGERDLLYELIKPCERAVFLTAYSILKSEADAEEVVQEAALKAYKALGSFRGEAKFSTWLVKITLNEARMRLRRSRSESEVSLEDLVDDGDSDYTPQF